METLTNCFYTCSCNLFNKLKAIKITIEANHITRARHTEDYQKLTTIFISLMMDYKEFDKLLRLLRKDIKSLNIIDELSTTMNLI